MPDSDKPTSNPLDYARPTGRAPRQGNRRQFWTGLVAGSIGSLIFWPIFMRTAGAMSHPEVAIFAFLIAKVVAGLGLSLSSRWKSGGGGVFISLGVGALIFLGTCGIAAANVFK